ncbi:hypothetical protein [Litorimonas haliclonae]|uniref:hypothetical protein n=1 Tax=Litorimonas haliclonae TaxID=2081977 RepID=UPI0039EF8C89
MDFLNFKAGVATLEIINPATGQGTGLKLDMLYFRDEKVKPHYEDYAKKIQAARSMGKDEAVINALEDERGLTCLAKSVVGWEWGDNTLDGKVPDFCEANVVELLKNDEVFAQAEVFTITKSNFFKGLNTGS